ncbi:MAG: DUF6471 domain-containing protein [Sulfurovum sp.]|nr:DUF6471 domain-containing protein [Sulfurovum sp.]
MKEKAREIINNELKKRKISYPKLSQMMKEKGYIYSDNTIRTKIHRGTFSFVFMLEVCESLEIEIIDTNNMLE